MNAGHFMKAETIARVTAISLAAALLLAGCGGAPTDTDSGSPSGDPSSAPDSSSTADGAPVPFVDLDCADLVPAATITAAVSQPVAPRPVVVSQGSLLTDGLPSVDEPMTFAARVAGGFSCEWSNGELQILDGAENPAYAGVVLSVLPDADIVWEGFASNFATPGTSQEFCYAGSPATCQIDVFEDGTWINLRGYSVAGATDAAVAASGHSIVDAAIAAIAAAEPGEGTVEQAEGTVPLSDDCGQFVSDADLSTDLGVGVELSPQSGAIPSIADFSNAAWYTVSSPYCYWYLAPDIEGYYDTVLLSWLEGADWAWNELKDGGQFSSATELTVPGLADGEAGYLECAAERCSVDLLVSHDWIWYSIALYPEISAVSAEDAATAVAARIVDSLH